MPSLFAIHGVRKKPAPDTNDKPNPSSPNVVDTPAPAPSGNNGTPDVKHTVGDDGPFM